jgi:hypothetical protein
VPAKRSWPPLAALPPLPEAPPLPLPAKFVVSPAMAGVSPHPVVQRAGAAMLAAARSIQRGVLEGSGLSMLNSRSRLRLMALASASAARRAFAGQRIHDMWRAGRKRTGPSGRTPQSSSPRNRSAIRGAGKESRPGNAASVRSCFPLTRWPPEGQVLYAALAAASRSATRSPVSSQPTLNRTNAGWMPTAASSSSLSSK